MGVIDRHRRHTHLSTTAAGALLDSLAGTDDGLWPTEHWPAMQLDRPLSVGASGGHGPIGYRVDAYVPGVWVRFRFTGPRGFEGFHQFCVLPERDGSTLVEHLLVMRLHGTARLTWPLVYRWLHDALIEDGLDRADRTAAPAVWSRWVRALRWVARRIPGATAARPPVRSAADLVRWRQGSGSRGSR